MPAVQIPLRDEMDAVRAKQWAESCARVFKATADDARGDVRLGRRTNAQAFAVCRRKFDSLSKEYFSKRSPWGTPEATERDWQEHGPAREYKTLYDEFFPRLAQ